MSGKLDFVIVHTTVAGEGAADDMARSIVGRRLAACVQRTRIRSTYRWKGAVESADEWLLIAKTRASLADRLSLFIRETHSYEVPEIIVTPIAGGDPDYLAWIEGETCE